MSDTNPIVQDYFFLEFFVVCLIGREFTLLPFLSKLHCFRYSQMCFFLDKNLSLLSVYVSLRGGNTYRSKMSNPSVWFLSDNWSNMSSTWCCKCCNLSKDYYIGKRHVPRGSSFHLVDISFTATIKTINLRRQSEISLKIPDSVTSVLTFTDTEPEERDEGQT